MTVGPLSDSSRADSPARLLSVASLSVDYGGSHLALDDVSVQFAAGQMHALLGSNGSGKSTLIKVLSGVVGARTGGTVTVGGAPAVTTMTPARASQLGLRFVHQDLALLPELSILENFYLTNPYPSRGGAIAWKSARTEVERALAAVHLAVPVSRPVSTLAHADRVLVATARALVGLPADGGFLFMDEPTAVLDDEESAQLLGRLADLAASRDVGIILVTHRLGEVLNFTDRVTILRDGRVVLRSATSDIDEPTIFEALAGADVGPIDVGPIDVDRTDVGRVAPPAARHAKGESFRLDLEDVRTGRLAGVTFSVAAGEIVGVTGLEGAGKNDLVDILFGLARPSGGTISINGAAYRPGGIRDALAAGIGLVPADRHGVGGIGELSVGENILLARLHAFSPRGWFRRGAARDGAQQAVERAGVRPPDPTRTFSTLSGGNQQKVIVGRWLDHGRSLMILHEPTAGVDVGARKALYARVREAAEHRGLAVLVVSSDLVEIAELCQRALVLVDGRITASLEGDSLTVEALTSHSYATGVAHQEAS